MRKGLKSGIVALMITLVSILIEFYHIMLKGLRGWTLFPGG
ncbi:MAG: hypothetical protein PHV58_01165 [Candidatus Omnitrophica bacterium]|nr:hypothetical protein [Candidatus Omnitrophota bacterium]